MTEAELIEMIVKKRNELEENRKFKVSHSLLRVEEDEIKELEEIYAAGEAARQAMRPFLDLCAGKYEVTDAIADAEREKADKKTEKEMAASR